MVEGRNVIVTGAGNGLGLAIARRFVELGARVLMVDKEKVVEKRVGDGQLSSDSAFALVKDLADGDAARVVFHEAAEKLGHVDTLINNAAWSFHKPMLEVSAEEFDHVVAINQKAPFFLAQEFLRHVAGAAARPADPVIVNIGSVNALSGNPNLVAYAGTKGAIVAMTRAMAVEMAVAGIRVNSISPGAVRTWVTQNLIESGGIVPEELVKDLPIKRFASCEEVAELVAYLCSHKAAYVDGVNWVIDGGYMAH
jgi:NAD(P)-dependent dehydrogenase (short-subunit alcohol dehydrogenase family)